MHKEHDKSSEKVVKGHLPLVTHKAFDFFVPVASSLHNY